MNSPHSPKLQFVPTGVGKFLVSVEVEPGRWGEILGVTERTTVSELFARAMFFDRGKLRDNPFSLVRAEDNDPGYQP